MAKQDLINTDGISPLISPACSPACSPNIECERHGTKIIEEDAEINDKVR